MPPACLPRPSEVCERLEPVGDSLGCELAELVNAHLRPLPKAVNDHDAPVWRRGTVDASSKAQAADRKEQAPPSYTAGRQPTSTERLRDLLRGWP
jgi:hypothetical protein